MSDTPTAADLSRRAFVVTTGVAGAGLLLGVRIPERRRRALTEATPNEAAFAPNAWVRLDENGAVTILVHKSEMGQGVWTALPMIVAEEMDADWRRVSAERAPTRPELDTATGGSSSVRDSWDALRHAGATARAMLVTAAARRWKVPESECTTSNGEVIHSRSRRRLAYGALARDAASVTPPDEKSLTLKDPRTFRIVGRGTRRLDTPAKVTGSAVFGMDVKVPGMLVAVVARCPTYSGSVKRVDDAKARAVPGVREVITLDPVPRQLPGRVAVLADDTWSAMQGCRALDIEWDLGEHANFSTDAMWQDARRLVDDDADAKLNRQWAADSTAAHTPGLRVVEATYEVPFVAHACMEPMNCTASVTANRVDLWLPSQFPEQARRTASQLTKVPLENVEAHVTFLGGGFGRRAYQDFVVEAVQLSQRAGKPVKVVWTREDDIQHDMYRPAQLQRFRAALDPAGRPMTWDNRIVGPSTEAWWNPASTTPQRREQGEEPPYDVATSRNDFVQVPAPVPLGAWRAVQNGQNGFCFESFVDECAHAAGMDPVAYRIARLAGKPRQQAVVTLAAEKAQWWTKLPKGRGRGIAFFDYDGTYVAQVAEVTVTKRDGVRVDRVVCAFDCGTVINPDTVRAQIESAVVWATTAALYGEITIKDGRTQQSNFHDYHVLRMAGSPRVEVHLIRNTEAPTGVGEPAVPPLAAALANAVFAATDVRLRALPLRLSEAHLAALG
jgi:isoquinoline 1-oxidoreductase subunit beta